MKQTATIEHCDQLGQPVLVNNLVAWTWRGGTGVRVGRVTRLTAKRVRIAYTTEWTHNDEVSRYSGTHITASNNVLVLDQGVEAQLTLLALKGLIP